MTENLTYISVTSRPWDMNYEIPNIGATGILCKKVTANKFLVHWDTDNPICGTDDGGYIPEHCFTEISREEYESRKFVSQKKYVKKYLRNAYDIHLDMTDINLIIGVDYDGLGLGTTFKKTVFLGCSFDWTRIIYHDLADIVFINCRFRNTVMHSPKPLINTTFINCQNLEDLENIRETQ